MLKELVLVSLEWWKSGTHSKRMMDGEDPENDWDILLVAGARC